MRTPIALKCATALTFINTFVLIEEFVIDRQGLSQYLPLYKVGEFCVWDMVAISLAIGIVILWQQKDNRSRRSEGS